MSEIVAGEVLAKWRQDTVTLKAYKHPEQLPNGAEKRDVPHREPYIIDKYWALNDAIDSARLGEEMN